MSNPEERGQGKLPGIRKSKLRAIRKMALANEDRKFHDRRGLSVCTLLYPWNSEQYLAPRRCSINAY